MTGSIDYDGDRDWFRVELEENTEYRFDLRGQSSGYGTLWDPYIHGVYDSDGARIPDTSNNNSRRGADSKLIFTSGRRRHLLHRRRSRHYTPVNHTGTYTLVVRKNGDDYPGAGLIGNIDSGIFTNYKVIGRVTVGGSTTGNLEREWDQDWFQVQLQKDKMYEIRVKGADTGDGTLADPYIHRLYKLNSVQSNNDPTTLGYGHQDNDGGFGRNSQLDFTPVRTGAYAISVQAWNSRDTRPPAARKGCRGPLRAIRGFRAAHPRRRC